MIYIKGDLVFFADIKVKEPNLDSMMKGKVVYDPPRFMTVAQAVDQLLQIILSKEEANVPGNVLNTNINITFVLQLRALCILIYMILNYN